MLFNESNGTRIDSAICIPSWPARWSSLPHLTRQRLTPAYQGNITTRHGQCTMTKFSPEQDAAIATLIAAVPDMLLLQMPCARTKHTRSMSLGKTNGSEAMEIRPCGNRH